MPLQLEDLIERGYFPKELPPSFNTCELAKNIITILDQWKVIYENNTKTSSPTFVLSGSSKKVKQAHRDGFVNIYNSSKATNYSISKGKLARRFLQIPNPKHFALLSEKIVNRWADFEAIYRISPYSGSYPVVETSPEKRSVVTFIRTLDDFRNELLKVSVNKLVEVQVDISKFYPTIYTHSVAWGILGKDRAKFFFKNPEILKTLFESGNLDAELYKYAESIDECIRASQERQSVGIPIGPDTSHMIAELIACRIDNELEKRCMGMGIQLQAYRYYDDFYLYVSTKDEADRILKALQLILSDFQLEVNESKVSIRIFPFAFEDEFTTALFLFDFKDHSLVYSLKHYFSLVWSLVEKYPEKSVQIIKYALRRFEWASAWIPKENWKIFEDILLKTALIEPAVLDVITRILITYNAYLDSVSEEKLSNLVNIIINEHCGLNHNFEVSWSLWIAKTFGITIQEEAANKIINTRDNISNLILLDLIKNTSLVKGHPSITTLEDELNNNVLFSESWLLAYEAVKKGWLVPKNPNLLDENLFFKLLKDNNIEFYNEANQLKIYTNNINIAENSIY